MPKNFAKIAFVSKLLEGERSFSKLLWTLLATFLRIGSGLLVLPIALRTIPQVEMGLYYTFLGLTGIAPLLDFGMMGTLVRNTSYAWAGAKDFSPKGTPEKSGKNEPNYALLHAFTRVISRWYGLLGGLVLLGFLAAGTPYVYREIHQADLDPSLLYCWFLFAIGTSIQIGTGFWTNILAGIGRIDASSRYAMVSQLIGLVFLMVTMTLGWGLWAYAISAIISPIPLRYLSRRLYLKNIGPPPALVGSLVDQAKEIFVNVWPMTWRQGVFLFGKYATNRGTTLVITPVLGLLASGSYGLTIYLVTIIIQIASVPLHVVIPDLAGSIFKEEFAKARRVFLKNSSIGVLLACLACVALVFAGDPLLKLIGSKTNLLPFPQLAFFCFVFIVDMHYGQYFRLVIVSNKNPFWLPMAFSAAFTVGFGYLGATYWGVTGLLVAKLLSNLLIFNYWPMLMVRRILQPAQPLPAV